MRGGPTSGGPGQLESRPGEVSQRRRKRQERDIPVLCCSCSCSACFALRTERAENGAFYARREEAFYQECGWKQLRGDRGARPRLAAGPSGLVRTSQD